MEDLRSQVCFLIDVLLFTTSNITGAIDLAFID